MRWKNSSTRSADNRTTPCHSKFSEVKNNAIAPPSTSTTFKLLFCAIVRSRTLARTFFYTSTMHTAAVSSCGDSRRTSVLPPIGGMPKTLGSRLQSAIRGWWRWACRKTRCKAFRKHFVSAWLRVLRSFVTTERTIPRTGTGRSVANRFTSKSASSATPKRSGAAPWRQLGSSIRVFRASPSC